MKNLIALETVLKNMPGIVGWKSIDHTYMGGNDNAVRVAGLKNSEDLVGKVDEEMPWCEYALNIHEMDNRILAGEHITYVEQIRLIDDSKWVIITQKKPIRDDGNKIVGLIFQCNFLVSTLRTKHTKLLSKFDLERFGVVPKQYEISEIFGGLSERESECLFYLLRGKSMKATADILSISMRTVETHLESIKNKLDCETKSDVIEKARQLGYIHIIPKKSFGNII